MGAVTRVEIRWQDKPWILSQKLSSWCKHIQKGSRRRTSARMDYKQSSAMAMLTSFTTRISQQPQTRSPCSNSRRADLAMMISDVKCSKLVFAVTSLQECDKHKVLKHPLRACGD